MAIVCEVCNNPKNKVHRNRKTGLLTCRKCYYKNDAPKKKCVICEEIRNVKAYLDEEVEKKEKPICPDCYSSLHFHDESRFELCSVCCELRPVYSRENGVVLCCVCHRHDESTHEICSVCGKLKSVATRDEKTKETTCYGCCGKLRYRDVSKHEICSICGIKKPVNNRGTNGEAICRNCSKKQKKR